MTSMKLILYVVQKRKLYNDGSSILFFVFVCVCVCVCVCVAVHNKNQKKRGKILVLKD